MAEIKMYASHVAEISARVACYQPMERTDDGRLHFIRWEQQKDAKVGLEYSCRPREGTETLTQRFQAAGLSFNRRVSLRNSDGGRPEIPRLEDANLDVVVDEAPYHFDWHRESEGSEIVFDGPEVGPIQALHLENLRAGGVKVSFNVRGKKVELEMGLMPQESQGRGGTEPNWPVEFTYTLGGKRMAGFSRKR